MLNKYLRYLPAATVDVLREYGEQWARLAVSQNPADTELAYMTSYKLLGKHTLFCLYTLPAVMGTVPYKKQWNSRPMCVRYLNAKYYEWIQGQVHALGSDPESMATSRENVGGILHYDNTMAYGVDAGLMVPDGLRLFVCMFYTYHIEIDSYWQIEDRVSSSLFMEYHNTSPSAHTHDHGLKDMYGVKYDGLAHFNRSKAHVADNVLDYVWNTTGRIHSL